MSSEECRSERESQGSSKRQVNQEGRIMSVLENENVQIKNHSTILYKEQLFIFGGYNGKNNHNELYVLDLATQQFSQPETCGQKPEARNGHSATLVNHQMFIIGGWFGRGTFASNDVYILDLEALSWRLCQTSGVAPGPCNMHSADAIQKVIYIFRGGDG